MSWSFGRYIFRGAAATAGVLDALTKRPGHDQDWPLVGCPNVADCREFGCAGYCSEADEPLPPTTPAADVTAWSYSGLMDWVQRNRRTDVTVQCGHCLRTVGGVGGFAVHLLACDLQPISESSAETLSGNGSAEPPAEGVGQPPRPPSAGPTWVDWATPAICTALDEHAYNYNCACGAPHVCDWSDWMGHAAPLIAAHLENAHKLNVRDGLETASELFPQFRTNQKGPQ